MKESAWKNFQWDVERSCGSALSLLAGSGGDGGGVRRTKYRFKEVARAVKFTSNLFGKALQRRIKAAILYATETGKSEKYAHWLADLFNHAFNAQVSTHSLQIHPNYFPSSQNCRFSLCNSNLMHCRCCACFLLLLLLLLFLYFSMSECLPGDVHG